MAEPPRKRYRSTDKVDNAIRRTCGSPGTTRIRDKEFWFEDGNLILIAHDVEYRVYKGPLIKHSPVFRDLLSLPQPEMDTQGTASCAVVELSDHPHDVQCLLRSLIFGNDLQFVLKYPCFDILSSLTRMGHKYQIDSIVQVVVKYLHNFYPADFDSWRAHRNGAPNIRPIEHIGIVNLAWLTDAHDILPAAFLQCCSLDAKALSAGFERPDGTRERLSTNDLIRVLTARTELLDADAYAYVKILNEVRVKECEERDCDFIGAILYALAEPGEGGRTFSASWSQPWESLLEESDQPCEDCLTVIREQEERNLGEMWEDLPGILGL